MHSCPNRHRTISTEPPPAAFSVKGRLPDGQWQCLPRTTRRPRWRLPATDTGTAAKTAAGQFPRAYRARRPAPKPRPAATMLRQPKMPGETLPKGKCHRLRRWYMTSERGVFRTRQTFSELAGGELEAMPECLDEIGSILIATEFGDFFDRPRGVLKHRHGLFQAS